jgi:hypothetical protein
MDSIDISVILTCHAETVVSGPTVRAVNSAAREAERVGLRVEKVAGLDNPTESSTEYFNSALSEGWKKFELSCGDAGEARNSLALKSSGKLIAFIDADDIFSENWLSVGATIALSDAASRKCRVVHPEINWFFDGANSVLCNQSQTAPLFLDHYWRQWNYYDLLCIARREAFIENPYEKIDSNNGFAWEDWRWNLEIMEKGYIHIIAPDTIIFKRRRDASLVTELSKNRSLLWNLNSTAIEYWPATSEDPR